MSASEANDSPDPRYFAMHVGCIVDNKDPEGLGRVRVKIPGLIEPASAWAFPLGTMGGGSAQRGFFTIPDKGAEVGVFFNQGDVDCPYYIAGHWGKPRGQSEVPTPIKIVPPAQRHLVKAYETERWLVAFDDRPGLQTLTIQDKQSGDTILFDGVTRSMIVNVTTALAITAKGAITMTAAAITLNGRPVAPINAPI